MPREHEDYRDNLASLRERFPSGEMISVPEAAKYLGVAKRRLLADDTFPTRPLGKQNGVILVNFAKWLSKYGKTHV
jgi:hypothetical protein